MPLLTNAVLLAPTGWSDLGAGPLTVSAHGPEWANVLLALSDAQPPASLVDGEPLRGARFFGTATHVWALALGQPARVVVTAPDVGSSLGGGGGGASGGPITLADGADAAQGSTGDAAWGGTGQGTLVAVAKGMWARLGAVTLAGGAAVVGKVGLDQTAPGASNRVSIGSDGTVNLGALNGVALDASVQSVKATLGAPFQAGGALGAGEAHLGEVGGNVGRFQAQFGPSTSTTYAAGQAMAAPIEVTGMGRVANGSGLIVGASLELAAANTIEVDLVMFGAQPGGSYAAGTAFTIAAADRPKVSKVLKLTDWTALGAADSLGEVVPAPKFYACEDAGKTTSLWVVPVARGSITLATATDATLKLRASRN